MDSMLGRDSILLRNRADLTWERERGGKGVWARIDPAHPCVLPLSVYKHPCGLLIPEEVAGKGKIFPAVYFLPRHR